MTSYLLSSSSFSKSRFSTEDSRPSVFVTYSSRDFESKKTLYPSPVVFASTSKAVVAHSSSGSKIKVEVNPNLNPTPTHFAGNAFMMASKRSPVLAEMLEYVFNYSHPHVNHLLLVLFDIYYL